MCFACYWPSSCFCSHHTTSMSERTLWNAIIIFVSADMTAHAIVRLFECVSFLYAATASTPVNRRKRRGRIRTEKSFGMKDKGTRISQNELAIFSRYFRLNEASQHISHLCAHIKRHISASFRSTVLVNFTQTFSFPHSFPLVQLFSISLLCWPSFSRAERFYCIVGIHAHTHTHMVSSWGWSGSRHVEMNSVNIERVQW